MALFDLTAIQAAITGKESAVVDAMEGAFRDLSESKATVAPVVHLEFPSLKADTCIKTGYVHGTSMFVVKIASGFPTNADQGLSTSSGALLLFSQRTGHLEAVLNDEGWLTDLRTAAAGAVAARHLAPRTVSAIGILGTGMQARFQARLLQLVTPCRRVVLWGRAKAKIEACRRQLEADGFEVTTTRDVTDVTAACNLIVTTTSARTPILKSVRPGTHITAMGSDGLGKQELDATLVGSADLLVADSKPQCLEFGEISHAIKAGLTTARHVVELGALLDQRTLHRQGDADDRVTIFDSTGVAVQDVAIAVMALDALTQPAKL